MEIHCCDQMKDNVENPDLAIRYYPQFREYGILYLDGGTAFQEIRHCPWCGARLPDSLRDKWFAEIESLGYQPGDADIPAKYLSAAWWAGDS